MKIAIIHCHTANRGDEAAVHALVDELKNKYPDCEITLFLRGETMYPNFPKDIRMKRQYVPIGKKKIIEYFMLRCTKGHLSFTREGRAFIDEVRGADLVLHAPGGPSIGDTYYDGEPQYLRIYDLLQAMGKRYFFYAPSMGPFDRVERNNWRKRVLTRSEKIVLRDPISAEYVKKLMPDNKVYTALDSAFQHDICEKENQRKYTEFNELVKFMSAHDKVIGVTIAELSWHPIFCKEEALSENVRKVFTEMVSNLTGSGFGIVFIPQLYGALNDFDYMKSFAINTDCFIIPADDEKYDTYFQQYLISRLYAVIGMRYHSNIFSAKMGIPFISVSYEQKMKGFMKKMELEQYCIDLVDLSYNRLFDKFNLLMNNYDLYKRYLKQKHAEMREEAYKTTKIVIELLDRKN